jgi:hypothetical protein
VYKVLVRKTEGKRTLGRSRRRWAQNGYLIDWPEGMDWIRLAQDRDPWPALLNTVMNLRVLTPRI